MEPLLTVITVNFNNLAGLELTMASVLPQLNQRIDYVVIDGGSTDGSAEFIQEHAHRLHYWCSENDGGIYQGMNKGVRHADGRYLLFINSGDELLANVLQQIEPLLDQEKADIIYGNIYFDYHNGTLKLETFPDQISLDFLSVNYLPHPGSFIRRTLLEQTPYNENLRIVADWEFFVDQIIHRGASTFHTPQVITRFGIDGVSANERELLNLERTEAHQRLFTPIIRDALEIIKLSEMDCFPEFLRLSKTRKLQRRIRPLLRFALWLDNLFKSKS